jgi:hypothetical protein
MVTFITAAPISHWRYEGEAVFEENLGCTNHATSESRETTARSSRIPMRDFNREAGKETSFNHHTNNLALPSATRYRSPDAPGKCRASNIFFTGILVIRSHASINNFYPCRNQHFRKVLALAREPTELTVPST